MQCEYLLTNGLSWGWWLVQRSVTLAVKYHTTMYYTQLVVQKTSRTLAMDFTGHSHTHQQCFGSNHSLTLTAVALLPPTFQSVIAGLSRWVEQIRAGCELQTPACVLWVLPLEGVWITDPLTTVYHHFLSRCITSSSAWIAQFHIPQCADAQS